MEENKVKLITKLQKMRVELQDSGLTKSGRNDFSKYDYFELSDFLPKINKILLANNVTTIYGIEDGKAILKFINCEDSEDVLLFAIPTADMTLKGANAIQNIGGLTTYTRRYLYMIAFEIAEDDEFDPNQKNDDVADTPKDPLIDHIKIDVLKKKMEEKGVSADKITSRYEVHKLEELTTSQFMSAMSGLEATKPVENVDIGL